MEARCQLYSFIFGIPNGIAEKKYGHNQSFQRMRLTEGVKTFSTEEPDEGNLHVRICGEVFKYLNDQERVLLN